MRKILQIVTTLCFCLLFYTSAHASLLSTVFSDVIYDDVHQKYWMTDMSFFASMTYENQISSVSAFTVGGLGWHMASGSEMSMLWPQNGDDFLEMFQGPGVYAGRYNQESGGYGGFFGDWEAGPARFPAYESETAHVVGVFGWDGHNLADNSGYGLWHVFDSYNNMDMGAWVVADGPLPVPEPVTSLLFLTGCVVLKMGSLRYGKGVKASV